MRGGKETQYAIGKTLAVMLVKNEVITICHSSKSEEV